MTYNRLEAGVWGGQSLGKVSGGGEGAREEFFTTCTSKKPLI